MTFIQGAEQMQQRALPGPRRTDDRNEFAAPHLHVDTAQHFERLPIASGKDLPQAAGHQERVHS